MNLNQITIPVLNIEKAIAFYQKLGLELIVSSIPEYARFVCLDGNTTFSLHRVNELHVGEGVWIYFEVSDVDARISELKLKGIQIDEEPTDQPWLWREAKLKDLDNNQIIIYFAGKNRIDPPWKLNN